MSSTEPRRNAARHSPVLDGPALLAAPRRPCRTHRRASGRASPRRELRRRRLVLDCEIRPGRRASRRPRRIRFGQPRSRIDTMKQSRPSVMCAHPCAIDVRDLVIDPDETTPSGSCDQRRRLPVQGADRILKRRIGEISHRQRREPEQRGDHLVRVVHPGSSPDQIAAKGQQASTKRAVHQCQPRVASTLPFLPIDKRRIELRPVAGQQRAIHVQEQQRTADHHGGVTRP